MVNSNNEKPDLLYIDDSPEFLLLFKTVLKDDYNITTTQSAKEGLEYLKNNKTRIIVADQRMPEMTGIDLLDKATVDYPDTLRFIISGFTDFQLVVDGVNNGKIHGFFNKPINPDEIRIAISKALEIQDLRERNSQIMEELKNTNIGLKNSNRNKTIFLQILSRQLSKPINNISGTIQALKDKIESKELFSLVNILDNNLSSLKISSSLAHQITLFEIHENKTNFTMLDAREIVEYLIIEKTEQLDKRKIKLNLIESEKNLKLYGDFQLVINSLMNMLENAMEHTPDKGHISIKIGKEENSTYFNITDEGLNYSEEVLRKTKAFFTTNEDSLNADISLGHILVKHILDAHDGKVRCACQKDRMSVKLLFKSVGKKKRFQNKKVKVHQ